MQRYGWIRTGLIAGAVVFAVGSGAMAQTGGVGAAPARRPEMCTQQYAPVCGELNGARKTYPNACMAALAEAKVVADGACR